MEGRRQALYIVPANLASHARRDVGPARAPPASAPQPPPLITLRPTANACSTTRTAQAHREAAATREGKACEARRQQTRARHSHGIGSGCPKTCIPHVIPLVSLPPSHAGAVAASPTRARRVSGHRAQAMTSGSFPWRDGVPRTGLVQRWPSKHTASFASGHPCRYEHCSTANTAVRHRTPRSCTHSTQLHITHVLARGPGPGTTGRAKISLRTTRRNINDTCVARGNPLSHPTLAHCGPAVELRLMRVEIR